MKTIENVQSIIDIYSGLLDKRADFKYVISKVKEEGAGGEPLELLEEKVKEIEKEIEELLDLDIQILSKEVKVNPLKPAEK